MTTHRRPHAARAVLLQRLATVREAQAQRELLAAQRLRGEAATARTRIDADLLRLVAEEAHGACRAAALGSVAALQAAQHNGAQLREEAQAQGAQLAAAQQQWAQHEERRRRAALQLRAVQARQAWWRAERQRNRAAAQSARLAADDEAAIEFALALRATRGRR